MMIMTSDVHMLIEHDYHHSMMIYDYDDHAFFIISMLLILYVWDDYAMS